MAKFTNTAIGLPSEQEEVENRFIRRPVKGAGANFRDTMTRPDMIMTVMLFSSVLLVAVPWLFIYTGIIASLYYFWAASVKYKLPFKIPINWGGTDYGSPKTRQTG